jgi:hypothetical protein
MSIIKLYSKNPSDGTTTFDQVRFYEATDSSGTGATLITAVDIDATTTSQIDSGYTTNTYSSGDTAKYYASTYYDSTTLIETDYSDWVQGGQDRWDTKFMTEMDDSSSEVWSIALRSEFKKDALNALYPDFFREVIDTSLTIQNEAGNQQFVYTVPFGIFSISEVGIGNVDTVSSTSSRNFVQVKNDYWTFEKNKLHFHTLAGLNHGDTIRLIANQKFLSVGEVPEYLDSLALLHMKMDAYAKLADDFPRFKTWARLQKGTRVSFENLRVHAREFERKFKEMKAELKENSYSALM